MNQENNSFFADLTKFTNQLIGELRHEILPTEFRMIDHVCYRVSTLERYHQMCEFLANYGPRISDAIINGRPISVYKLTNTIPLQSGFAINLIELPSPKPGRHYDEGFEHIEVVIDSNLETFMQKHSHLTFDTANQFAKINRDISSTFKTGLVKFHEQSLEDIIAAENQSTN
ncbi:MAG: VOC family protein [Proteobacteria bacterium]|nr:VOC family protein [Pseudomonadota bacterium]